MINEQNSPPAEENSSTQQVTHATIHIPFPDSFAYANCCAFSIGQTEIRLGFAEAMQDGKAIPKCGVVLPPETAAVIALVLFQQVKTYEENFGEIRHKMWKAMKAGLVPTSPYQMGEAPSIPEAQTEEIKL